MADNTYIYGRHHLHIWQTSPTYMVNAKLSLLTVSTATKHKVLSIAMCNYMGLLMAKVQRCTTNLHGDSYSFENQGGKFARCKRADRAKRIANGVSFELISIHQRPHAPLVVG